MINFSNKVPRCFLVVLLLCVSLSQFAQNSIELSPYYLIPSDTGWYYQGGTKNVNGFETHFSGCDREYSDYHHFESGVQQGFTLLNTIIMPTCWPINAEEEDEHKDSNVQQGYIQLGKTMYLSSYGTANDSSHFCYVISPPVYNLDSIYIEISPDVTPGIRSITLDIEYSVDGGKTWNFDAWIQLGANNKLGNSYMLTKSDQANGLYFEDFMNASRQSSILIRFMSTDRSFDSHNSQRIKIHNIKIYGDEETPVIDLTTTNSDGISTSDIIADKDSLKVHATINVDSLKDKTLKWSVSNTNLAKISSLSNNEIMLAATGKDCGGILVSSVFDEYPTIEQSVIVNISNQNNDTSISILNAKADTNVYIADSIQLIARVYPESTCTRKVTWFSIDESIIEIDTLGMVKGITEGTTTVVAYSQGNFTDSITITCQPVLDSVVIISITSDQKQLYSGDSISLFAEVLPENTTNKSVVWSSSNEEIATVTSDGIVRGGTAGEVSILATTASGGMGTLKLNCQAGIVIDTSVVIIKTSDEITIPIAETMQLTAQVSPENADDISVEWTTENEQIAIVSSGGILVGVSEGKTIVKVSSASNHFDTVPVSVVKTSSINNNRNDGINFYPNPVKTSITVNCNKICRVAISDISGAIVLDELLEDQGILALNLLNPGLYLIHIISDEKQQTFKLIKQ